MNKEIIKSEETSEELKNRTQEFFKWGLMAEFSPIMNTMISNLR